MTATIATTDITPRAWIGCLACYNAGHLNGQWFDATEAEDVTPEDLGAHVNTGNPHDELWVMDHEYLGISGECDPMEASRLGRIIEEVPESLRGAFFAWIEYLGRDIDDDAPEEFQDAYCDCWETWAEYVEEFVEDTGMLEGAHETLARYFDYDKFGRDLKFDYHVIHTGEGVHVFHAW